MRKLVMVVVFLASYCISDAATAGTINLVSAVKLPDQRWQYTLNFDVSKITGDLGNPVFMGDLNGWTRVAATAVSGNVRVTVATYNRESRVALAGNEATGSWFVGNDSGYWDSISSSIVIGFCNGQLYVKGAMPADPGPAGTTGDAYFRYKISGSALSAYVNLTQQNGGLLDSPFAIGNLSNWGKTDLTIVDSYGWATVAYAGVSLPCVLELAAGGHWNPVPSQANWIDFSQSGFYDPAKGCIKAAIGGAPGDSIKLIDAVKQGDQRWAYTIAVNANYINGDKAQPVFMGDCTDWRRQAMTVDGQGWLVATVTTFNRESRVNVAGNEAANAWFYDSASIYWVAAQGSLVVVFIDGQLYIKGQVPAEVPPVGSVGDSYLRYRINGASLELLLNLSKQVGGSFDRPFVMIDRQDWQAQPLTILDSFGWASFTVANIGLPTQIKLVGGGHWDANPANINWLDFSQSAFYDATGRYELVTIGEAITLAGTAALPDGRTEYTLNINSAYLGLDRSQPTIAADFDNWTPVRLAALPGGLYQAKLVTSRSEFRLAFSGKSFAVDSKKYLADSSDGQVVCPQPRYAKSPFGQSDDFSQWLAKTYGVYLADLGPGNGALSVQAIETQNWAGTGAVVIDRFGLLCE